MSARPWSPTTGLYLTCTVQTFHNFISRQLLPVFNLFKQKNCKLSSGIDQDFEIVFLVNIGDGIDYHQRHTENVGDLIQVKFI